MWKRGRGREDMSSGREGVESLEEEGNREAEDTALWCVGRRCDLPSHFHLGFSSPLALLPDHKCTSTHSHVRYMQAHMHLHAYHMGIVLTFHSLAGTYNLHTSISVLIHSFTCAGPLTAWPVFQVHSPGNSGPYQGGIPVPPSSISQVHSRTLHVTSQIYFYSTFEPKCFGEQKIKLWKLN